MQSANWVSAENGLCVVQTTEINEFGTGSIYVILSIPLLDPAIKSQDDDQCCDPVTGAGGLAVQHKFLRAFIRSRTGGWP